jgi:hypothetical protein
MPVPLYVVFTMDCERIAAESPPGGPETWEFSEQSIVGFCRTLLDCAIHPTLFVVPESAQRHSSVLKDLAAQGVELGLHIHPQSLADHRYERYLGEYSASMQGDIIERGLKIFVDAIGERPRSFRPGNFSASDETFGLLHSLGFGQGSVSDPGRDAPRFAAMWKDTDPYPHWANGEDRLRSGSLPFLEIPLTTDPARGVDTDGLPYELRIESGAFETWHAPIIREILHRMNSQGVPFRCLCLLTHNYVDYGAPGSDHSRTLRDIVASLDVLRESYEIRPITLAAVRHQFVEAMGKPPNELAFGEAR